MSIIMSEPVSGSSRDFFHDFFTTESISTDRVTGLIIETLKASYGGEEIREFTSKAKLSDETPIDIAIASILKQAPQMPIQEHLKQRLLALNDLDPAVALPQVKEIIEVAKRAGLTILDLDIDRLNAALIGKISQEIADLRLLKAVVRGRTYCKDVPREKLTETFVFALVSKEGSGLQYIPILMRTPEICLAAVSQNGSALEYVPEEMRTRDICLAAVSQNGSALEYIPEEMRTRDICLAAVSQNGSALEYVPEEMRTRDICLAAISQNGFALGYVPIGMRTPEICLAAVNQDGCAFGYVPILMRTPEICLAAVNQYGRALKYVPILMRTPEICLAAVNQYGRALKYVPIGRLTVEMGPPEICLSALTENGLAIEYFPIGMPINIGMRTRDICLAAVSQNGSALEYVPEEMRTRDICLAAVSQNGFALQYVPEEMRTPEICLAAVNQDASAFGYVPIGMRTPEIYLATVNQQGYVLEYIPKEMRTQDICLAAVSQNGFALMSVPKEMRTRDICLAAVNQKGLMLQCVPKAMIIPEICLAAVSQNGSALEYVPEEMRTRDICLAAVSQNGFALQYLPEEMRTRDICLAAITKNIEAVKYVVDVKGVLEFGLSTIHLGGLEMTEGFNVIKDILNYRNHEIRQFLILSIFSQIVNGKIKQVIRELMVSSLGYARLPLLCIRGWLEDEAPTPEAIINFFTMHRKAIKSRETGSLQTMLSFLMHLNRQSYTSFEKLDILSNCLISKKEDLKESISRMNYSSVLFSISPELLPSIIDFSSDNLVQIAINFLVERGVLDSNAESIRQLKATFLGSRIPTALFTYIKGFIDHVPSPEFQEALKKFINGVLKGTFTAERNEANSHGSYLSRELKGAWETGESRVEVLDSGGSVVFNPSEFFETKIKMDRHAGDKLDGFLSYIEIGTAIEAPNPLERLCLDLYSSKEKAAQLSILRDLEKVLGSEEYAGLEFINDIKAQIDLLTKGASSSKKIKLVDSDDWQDLFFCGTEVLGSCQRVDGDPQLNKCLLGYVLDGKIRILAIKNEEGKVLARAIFKLLLDKENRPILFLERIYPGANREEVRLIREFAQDRALKLGLPLYEHGRGEALHSERNAAPFEYEDAGLGVTRGSYTLSGALIPPRGGAGAGAGAGAF